MSKRILVADDDRHVVALVRDVLIRRGHRVTSAASGAEAISAVEQNPPDLLLISLVLPDLDGGSVAQRLSERPETRDLPILFLTNLVSEQELRRRGPKIGGRFFLAKPFDGEQLWEAIEMLLPAN